MKIAIGSGHGGFEYKQELISYIESKGHEVVDCGAYELDPLDNFPSYVEPVCEKVLFREADRGILICGTGIGVSMAANRFRGIRAAVVYSEYIARRCRMHNDANIACFGARDHTLDQIQRFFDLWIQTEFLEGKYKKRNDMLDEYRGLDEEELTC